MEQHLIDGLLSDGFVFYGMVVIKAQVYYMYAYPLYSVYVKHSSSKPKAN